MKHIVSIQSHVANGYVGNRSAVFPLQRLGNEVSFINTVQFSNHTGYEQWTGEIFSATHIQNVIDGLWQNNCFNHVDAILSGYQGSQELGEVIIKLVKELKTQHKNLLYCCDPVIGDIDRDIYVLAETAAFIKNKAILLADIITPNQFELGYLTDTRIHSLKDVLSACKQLHQLGPKIILVTSLLRNEIDDKHIEMLVSTNNETWLIKTPKFNFEKSPSGSGDATAAIFLAKYLQTNNIVDALQDTTAALYAIFKKTYAKNSYELQLIAAQDEIVEPKEYFYAEKII